MSEEQIDETDEKSDLLSFKRVGRIIPVAGIRSEFKAMSSALKNQPTPTIMARVGRRGGTHLLKMVTPRTELSQSLLRIRQSGANVRPAQIFSANAADIPFGKLVNRPLEIEGHPPRSIVDHILNEDDVSKSIFDAFESVFGKDCYEALREGVLADLEPITKLPAKEFTIVFGPSPLGGDLQLTPLAPASAYMDFKNEVLPFFSGRKMKDGPPAPYAPRIRQEISAHPQNVSGAIGGARIRFLARMPAVLSSLDAEIWRYAKGGGDFPLMREESIDVPMIRYVDLLERERDYSNQDIRQALDRRADQLIDEVAEFIVEILSIVAERHPDAKTQLPPAPSEVLMRRKWGSDTDRVRLALIGPHFDQRERRVMVPATQRQEL